MIYYLLFLYSLISDFSAGLVWAHSCNCVQLADIEDLRWTHSHVRDLSARCQLGSLEESKLPLILRTLNQLTSLGSIEESLIKPLLMSYVPMSHWPRQVTWSNLVNVGRNLPLDEQSGKEFEVIFNPPQCHRNPINLILLLLLW